MRKDYETESFRLDFNNKMIYLKFNINERQVYREIADMFDSIEYMAAAMPVNAEESNEGVAFSPINGWNIDRSAPRFEQIGEELWLINEK